MRRLIITAITIILAVITAAQHTPTFNIFAVRAGIDKIEKIQSSEEDDVRRAVVDALKNSSSYFISSISDMIRVDNVTISEDGNWATAWLVLSDPTSGDPLPSEPGLATAEWDGTRWMVSLPGDPTYSLYIANAPQELINYDTRIDLLAINRIQSESESEITTPLSGYLLPWRAGETVFLSRSVAHDADITSGNAHYSFDFYISKTMFDIHAAKSGTVYLWRDDVPNDNHDSVNYLVLKDTSTYPVTYQLYLHLAQDSIPPTLKQIGAPIAQGQYIGIADNTGASTGHHLHFQVESTPYWSYWGVSVDIQFSDVAINGGRPRVSWDEPYCQTDDVCDEFSSSYISANVPPGDITPPVGDMFAPQTGDYITNNKLDLEGWAADGDSGLSYARFKAKIEGEWQPIGQIFTSSPFSYQWDLCAQNVPDGPISLALEIRDNDGNMAAGLPGLRHVIKEYQCPDPQPVCSPEPNQIVLYSEADFQGTCTVLEHSGNPTLFYTLGTVGVNEATSLQVGSNSLATLFDNTDGSGRGDTFIQDDANLSDNRIGSDRASSLAIYPRTYKPAVPQPLWPQNASTHREYTSQTLVADDRGGAREFRFVVNGEQREWQSAPILHMGSNPPGEYLWRVQARNGAGETSWSPLTQFTITSNPTTSGLVTAPYSDDMENGPSGWVNSSYWDQASISNPNGGSISWVYDTNSDSGYATGSANYGDLTSPPVSIPETGFFLRFWYRYETETTNSQWDQRWVQISRNGGKFVNLLQLHDDPPNWWLRSPAIDLSDYAGDTIQVRFHFETLDDMYNNYLGWYIDDFTIDQTNPPYCITGVDAGDTPALAQPISYNQEITAEICPGGDIDFYSFYGIAGDHVGVTTQAQQIDSDLDTYIFLLDGDGTSVVTENDDIVYAEQTDSQFSYTLNRTGVYFLKVQAWNHPTAGGETYSYTMGIYHDGDRPLAAFTNPPGAIFLPTNGVPLLVQANDMESGMSHVDFYWHSGDWQNTDWIYLDTDSVGSDGWSTYLDTSSISDQREVAFYAKVFDYAGNRKDVVVWDLAIDHTPPTTQLKSLPESLMSSVIHLEWSGTDNLAGMGYYDLQAKIDDETWQTWGENIPSDQTEKWFLVDTGHSYAFRIRGVDLIGNQEAFSLTADASTRVPDIVCSQTDQWEIDNTSNLATHFDGVVTNQIHNFCNPLDNSTWQGDEDWAQILLRAGDTLHVDVIPTGGAAPGDISIFNSSGGKIGQSPSIDFGQPTSLEYISAADQTVFLRIIPIDDRITGDDASYQVIARVGYFTYLPTINNDPG